MDEPALGYFGDPRRAATGDDLLAAMQKHRTMCLAALAEDRNEARRFQRFLDHEAVSMHEMVVHAGRQSGVRAAGRHVLALADSSEMNYAAHAGRKRGFGTVGSGKDIGVLLHPIIAVDAERGGLIGLVGAEVINRADTGGQSAAKPSAEELNRRPAEEKESYRWLAGTQTAGEVLAAAATITMVEDREGDIYDQFARRPDNVHLLVRAASNRTVDGPEKLFERCASWSAATHHAILVPAKRGPAPRAERSTVVAVRYGEVTLTRPRRASKALAATVCLRVVDVREVEPPADPDQRVHWCLLTTHAVDSTADAMRIIGWYRQRWIIEQVFRTMKTDGVAVETSQITTPGSLLKLVAVALLAAIRVMQMVLGRDGSTAQPLTDVADPSETRALQAISASLEGKTEKLKNSFDPASLAWYAWIAARLGGWSGYNSKGYKPPGPKTMARGLKRLDAMVQGWKLANRSALLGLP